MIRHLPETKTFCSVCAEQDYTFWKIDQAEKNVKIIMSYKIVRNLTFMKVLENYESIIIKDNDKKKVIQES